MIGFFFYIVVFLLIGIGVFAQHRYEKRVWNKGVCKETGCAWNAFAMDSGGATGYTSGNYTIWVSLIRHRQIRM